TGHTGLAVEELIDLINGHLRLSRHPTLPTGEKRAQRSAQQESPSALTSPPPGMPPQKHSLSPAMANSTAISGCRSKNGTVARVEKLSRRK
ncbi:hypothetical protein, partial [Actinotignum sp. GS-2025b]|uniref:hypothetical protein n=1 Tax=Actinotignum sp. GS-2025b TaxID=3427275 RepID=UPI003F44886C